jgi:hypothetical protein
MFKGSREQGVDYFDDVLGNNDDGGILQGLGLNDFDSVRERVAPQGIVIDQASCHRCGHKKNLEITWEELFYVSQNRPGGPLMLPEGWSRSDQNMTCYIQLKCPKCSEAGFAVHYTPDEARNRLRQAADSGFVNEPMAQQWAQKIAMYAPRR